MRLAVSHGEPAAPSPYASLSAALRAAAGAFPDGQFLHAQRGDAIAAVSFAATLQRALGLAAALQQRGLQPGDGLVLTLQDSADVIPALWAALLGGFVVVPLQTLGRHGDAARREALLSFVCAALGQGCIVTDDPALHAALDGPARFPVVPLAALEGDAAGFAEGGARRDGACLAILTSGTTGRPKLVGFSEQAVMARWWPRLPAGGEAAAFLSWSPFDHIMGLGLAAPNLAAKIHLDARHFAANPLSWLDVIERCGATHATMTNFGLSLIVEALARAPQRRWRLDHVRKIGVGAEPVSPALCAEFRARLMPFGLAEDAIILGYGLTECGPVVGGGAAFTRREAGAVALDRPTAGHAVRIVGEDGTLLAEEAAGHIEVRGPTMTSGYLGEGEAPSFTADGWLRTGDLGFLRDGMLSVLGRAKEQIVVNARKISCLEIEEAIAARGRFGDVFVAPLGEAVAARKAGKPVGIFVVDDRGDAPLAEVAAEIRAIVAAVYQFAPAVVGLIRSADVPRTALGKVQRFALADALDDPQFADRLDWLAPRADKAADLSALERRIAAIWAALLRCDEAIDREADFFVLGGDSILALQMAFRLEERFGVTLPLEAIGEHATLKALAALVAAQTRDAPKECEDASTADPLPPQIVAQMQAFLASWPGERVSEGGFLRRVGPAREGRPVFWFLQNEEEARQLGLIVGTRRPAFALRSGVSLFDYASPVAEGIAARYVAEIKQALPGGPYVIGGNCQGAILALAVARRLRAEGLPVQLLAIADTVFSDLFEGRVFDAPVALYPAAWSKFSPFRKFRFPDAGLKKLFPAGLRMTVIPAGYAFILWGEAGERMAGDLEQAIAWSRTPQPARAEGRSGGYPDSVYAGRVLGAPETFPHTMTLRCGEPFRLDVLLRNDSPLDWAPFAESGFALGNHWLSPEGEVAIWSDGWSPLTDAIPSGACAPLSLAMVAPHRPGRYVLELDLVEEGVRWFSEKYLLPLHLPVTVQRPGRMDFVRRMVSGRQG